MFCAMLILQIALGVAAGMLLFKGLTETALGKWLMVAAGWLLVAAVIAIAGWLLWLWKPEEVRNFGDGLAFIVMTVLVAAFYMWTVWTWKFEWPRIKWTSRIVWLFTTAVCAVIPFAGWIQWVRPTLRLESGIVAGVLLPVGVVLLWKLLPNRPPPGYNSISFGD